MKIGLMVMLTYDRETNRKRPYDTIIAWIASRKLYRSLSRCCATGM
jgi:hypothetical protein